MKKTASSVTIADIQLDINPTDCAFIPPEHPMVGQEDDLAKIAYAINKNMPVLMVGETGVGKTSLIRHLAHKTHNGFRRMNLNGQTSIDEFVGKTLLNQEGTYWQDGVLIDAMRHGYWLLLDEINAALPEILFVLHSLLDDDHYVVLAERDGEIVRPHPNFRLFATMNPSGRYTGTKELNKAFLSRFPMILQVVFPQEQQEVDIINLYSSLKETETKNLVHMANDLRAAYKKDEIEYLCSTRDLINCAIIAQDIGMKQAIKVTLLNRISQEDFKAVNTIISLYFGRSGTAKHFIERETAIKTAQKIAEEYHSSNKGLEEFARKELEKLAHDRAALPLTPDTERLATNTQKLLTRLQNSVHAWEKELNTLEQAVKES